MKRGEFAGRNIHFGIREHAMGAIVNGDGADRGLHPVRLDVPRLQRLHAADDPPRGALARAQSIFVFTHDSVYLGEDGPTHQPVEHFWALRLIPNLDVVRPADALECAAAWTHALTHEKGPTVMALTRQNLPHLERPAGFDPKRMLRGALRRRRTHDDAARS